MEIEKIISNVGVPVGLLILAAWAIRAVFNYVTKEKGPVDRIITAHIQMIETVEDSTKRQNLILERLSDGQDRLLSGLERNSEVLSELVELHRSGDVQ